MLENLNDWLSGGKYLPRAVCLGYDTVIIDLYAILNVTTFVCFLVTAIVLLRYRSGEKNADLMRIVIGLFLASQAVRGLSQTGTLFLTYYRFDLAIHAATTGMAVVASYVALRVNSIRGRGKRDTS